MLLERVAGAAREEHSKNDTLKIADQSMPSLTFPLGSCERYSALRRALSLAKQSSRMGSSTRSSGENTAIHLTVPLYIIAVWQVEVLPSQDLSFSRETASAGREGLVDDGDRAYDVLV